MLGVAGGGHGPIHQILNDWQQIEEINLYAVALSVAVLALIVGSKRLSKKIPGALIAVIGAMVVSWAFDLKAHGVHVLGAIPSGLPSIGLPDIKWSWQLFEKLIPTAFAMFIVILAQSAATSRAYAARYNERFSENVDLVGLGIANVGAGLSGTFVVNGSPTKTQMVDSAGGRSQLAQISTTVIVLVVLLFLTEPLGYMPEAVLSAVVFLIGVELIDITGMRKIYAEAPTEFWVALITVAVVVFWGVEQGIVLAMVLSLLDHVRRGYRPKNAVIVEDDQQHWHAHPINNPDQVVPGLLIYRFTHSMYYANAEQLSEQVLELVKGAQPALSWFCIDVAAVDDVDFSAAETLRSIHGVLKLQGVRFVVAAISDDVKAELDRYELTDQIGEDAFYETLSEVVNAYRQQTSGDE
jgi:MFS superfamily sulfate permease-like transporter